MTVRTLERPIAGRPGRGRWRERWLAVRSPVVLWAMVLSTHGLALRMSDLRSAGGRGGEAFAVLALLALGSLLPLSVWACWKGDRLSPTGEPPPEDVLDRTHRFFAFWALVSSVGVALHWHAKWGLLGGEPFGGWNHLRNAWIHQPPVLPPWRRIESVAGHLLSSAGQAGLFFSAEALFRRGGRRALGYFLAFAALVFLYALAMVSRSALMADLILVFLAWSLARRRRSGTVAFRRGAGAALVLAGLSLVFVRWFLHDVISYSPATGTERVASDARSLEIYENGFADELPVVRDPAPDALRAGVRRAWPSANVILLYLNHGLFNFAEVLGTDRRGPPVVFGFVRHWKSLLFLAPRSTGTPPVRPYGRGGLTLPGAAYHDFGVGGVVAAALILGSALALAEGLLRRGGVFTGPGLILFVASGLTTGVSGIFVGPSVAVFPVVLFGVTVFGAPAFRPRGGPGKGST